MTYDGLTSELSLSSLVVCSFTRFRNKLDRVCFSRRYHLKSSAILKEDL